MKKNIYVIIIAALLLIVGVFSYKTMFKTDIAENTITDNNISFAGKEFVLYKSPNCGCCVGYAQALKDKGAKVKVVSNYLELKKIREKYGLAENKQSCHTTEVDGYFIEGHVPLKVVNKFLNEKPMVKGITLPGMPSGTPGMPGKKTEVFHIEAVDNLGNYFTYLKY